MFCLPPRLFETVGSGEDKHRSSVLDRYIQYVVVVVDVNPSEKSLGLGCFKLSAIDSKKINIEKALFANFKGR